ncbi:MAG TPA: ABC transporter permease [Vicinamibacterales bacterium]
MNPFGRVFWRPRVGDEVDEELAFHFEMRVRDLVERGWEPSAARREARRRVGNLDATRDQLRTLGTKRNRTMQRWQYAGELAQDIVFAFRQLRKNPGFAAVAILTLALGIGGTTAIFSLLNAVLLHPLPLRESERLLVVGEVYQGNLSSMSAGNYIDAAAGTVNSLEGLAAANFLNFNLADGVSPERVVAATVTANFFDVMGARPELGRTFTSQEDQPGNERVVVLSHHLWARQLGGRGDIVGRDIRMNGVNYTVVGVMPASFDLSTDTEDLWTPIAFTPQQRVLHDEHHLEVYGRLKPGVSREQLQRDLEAVAVRNQHDFPQDCTGLTFATRPFGEQFVGDYRARLIVLFGAVAVILLIACSNVGNLLLARGAARGREIAVRTALGAGRGRIIRQLLTESVVLALAAAAAGVAIAHWAILALVAWTPPGVPRIERARIDPAALVVAIALAFLSSVLCGLAPALRLARSDVQRSLRDGGRGASGGGFRDRVRVSLIVAEVALSLLLLFGAGLLIRSAIAREQVPLGFESAGVLTARFTLPDAVYTDPVRESDVLRRINEAAAQLPGVTASTVTQYVAMGGGGGGNGLFPEGAPEPVITHLVPSVLHLTTPGFFKTMRTPIVKGRGFTDDDRAGGEKVMIVSVALAAKAFPGQDPIGKRIDCCEPGPEGGHNWKTVIGVAADLRSQGPSIGPRPEFYLPLAQAPQAAWHWFRTFYVVVKTDGDPLRLAEPVRAAIARVDPDLPLFDVKTMDQRIDRTLSESRFNTLLLSLLGGIGLLLAAGGIYGVIAYFVSQRTQEIGVRIALGASRRSVVVLILAQALKPVAIGVVVGVVAALAASRVLSSQLFGVTRTDPLTIVAVVATLLGVALVASAIPARRAASIDPTRALQAE